MTEDKIKKNKKNKKKRNEKNKKKRNNAMQKIIKLVNSNIDTFPNILSCIALITSAIIVVINYINSILNIGYSGYLGFYDISLQMTNSILQFWHMILFSFGLSLIFYINYKLIYYFWNKINKLKMLFYNMGPWILIFTLLLHYYLGEGSCIFSFQYAIFLSAILVIPCFSYVGLVYKICENPKAKNVKNKDKKEDHIKWKKRQCWVFPIVISIFGVISYWTFGAVDGLKTSGKNLLLNEKYHNIIEYNNEKYLLLKDKNDNKIIMCIVDEKNDEYNMKTYYVKKGKYAYLNEYNKLTIKVEECKIDIK